MENETRGVIELTTRIKSTWYSEGSSMRTIEDVLNHLRAEYMEMPGLRLKARQVQRLCGIEPTMCQQVLDCLVNERFLCAKSDGYYARLTDGRHPHPRR
jgi:hypothetical protein